MYVGYYYGAYIDLEKYFSEDEIDQYFDQKGIIYELDKKFGFDSNSTEEGYHMFIAEKVFGYEVYFSGALENFQAHKLINFDKDRKSTVEKELTKKLESANEFLVSKGLNSLPSKLDFSYFTHAVT